MKLGDRKSITDKTFEKINWLAIHESVNQCILSCIYKFQKKEAPDCMDKIFPHAECNGISTRYSYQKLKLPHRKKKSRFKELYHISVPDYGITKTRP